MGKLKKEGQMNFWGFWVFLGVTLLITVCSLAFFSINIEKDSSVKEIKNEKQYQLHYVLITKDNSSPFWNSVYQNARKEAEKMNAYVERMGDDRIADYTIEQKLEMAIASRVDGIIVEGNNSFRTKKLIEQAGEQKIPVVTVFRDEKDSTRKSFVGVSNFEVGKQYGRQLCKIMQKRKKKYFDIRLLMEDSGHFDQDLIYSGIKEALQKMDSNMYSIRIQRVPHESAFSTEETIRDIFMEQKVPDILVCLDVNETTCAYQAVVDYNRVGKTSIVGFYSTETIRKAIEHEVIDSTILVKTDQMGKECVNALMEYREMGYVSEYLVVDTMILDSQNIMDYQEEEEDAD